MNYQQRFGYRWQQLAIIMGLTLAFFLPWSTALTAIFSGITVICVLLAANWRAYYALWRGNLVVISSMLLYLLLIVACAYGTATWPQRLNELRHYLVFLYIPLFMPIFQQERWRQYALHIFLISMTLILVFSIMKYYLQFSISAKSDPATIIHDHISEGLLLAFTGYLYLAQWRQLKSNWRWLYLGCFLVTAIYLLFMNTGRTATLTFIGLLALFIFQQLSLRYGLLTLLGLAIAIVLTFHFSPNFSNRFHLVYQEVNAYQTGKGMNTSSGLRITWWDAAGKMLQEHPLLGVGTGGYENNFSRLYDTQKYQITDQANNDLLNIVAQLGIIGGLVLLLFYVGQAWQSWYLPSHYRHSAQALLLLMLISGLFNSVLRDAVEAHFIVYFIALFHAPFSQRKTSVDTNAG